GFKPFDPQAESDGFVQFLADNPTCPGNDNCMQELMRNTFTSFEDIDAALAVAAGQFNDDATTVTFVPGAHYTFQTTWSKFRQPDDINLHNINVAPRLSIGWDPWNDGKTKI